MTNEDNVLVIAGAGSGKTKVIENKVNYLVGAMGVDPSEILVLAFNNKAVQELQERIPILGEGNIKTFHSFGSKILKYDYERQLFDLAGDSNKYFNFIKQLIIETIEDSNYYNLLYTYFRSFFYKTKNLYDFESLSEYNNYIYENKLLTLNSEVVKSFGEIDIANFLFLHNIPYEYEAEYKAPYEKTREHNIYRPDFYIPANDEHDDIYIEFFGINRENNTPEYIDKDSYNESIEWKRQLHRRNKTNLIELYAYDRFEGHLLRELKRKLKAYNVDTSHLLPREERLNVLNSQKEIDDFTRLSVSFMQHFKENKLSYSVLLSRLLNDFNSFVLKLQEIQKLVEKLDVEARRIDDTLQINNLEYQINVIRRKRAFLKIFNAIYKKYQNILKKDKKYDFTDMISQASDEIYKNFHTYKFKYKYILVDEFQDISKGRAEFLKVLLSRYEDSKLFVVGDDWQSINRFAGSDLSVMTNFGKEFGANKTRKSLMIKLSHTYRFNSNISEVASKFVQQNPFQIKKDITARRAITPSVLVWYANQESEALKDIVMQIYHDVKKERRKDASVLILGRYNINKNNELGMELYSCIKDLKQTYDGFLEIEYSTIHSSKGLGKDYVIILSLRQGAFPSAREDDPILDMVMANKEDFDNAEERRLFYVALTRAKEKVYLVGQDKPSAFLVELTNSENNYPIYICNLPDNYSLKICPQCKTGMMVRPFGENDKFYYCHNYVCQYKAPVCPICGKGFLYKDKEKDMVICSNDECLYIAEECEKCGGILLHRQNRQNGSYFISCSNYAGKERSDSCRNTHRVKKCAGCKKEVFLYKKYCKDENRIILCCSNTKCEKIIG